MQAAYAKNRKEAVQPLPADVADVLRGYLAGKPAEAPFGPGPGQEAPAKMIRGDLAEARKTWLAIVPGCPPTGEGRANDFLTYS